MIDGGRIERQKDPRMAGLKDQRKIDQGHGVGSRLGYISAWGTKSIGSEYKLSVSVRVRVR